MVVSVCIYMYVSMKEEGEIDRHIPRIFLLGNFFLYNFPKLRLFLNHSFWMPKKKTFYRSNQVILLLQILYIY